MLKNYLSLIFTFIFLSCIHAQNTTTKFISKGYLSNEPNIIAKSICKYKKDKKVNVITYIYGGWWEVKYEGYVGYVPYLHLLLTDDLNNMVEIVEEKVRIKEKNKNDSILNISLEKQKHEYKKLIEYRNSLSDSSIIATVRKGAFLKNKPDLFGSRLIGLKENEKIIITDYLNNHFKACTYLRCGYIDEIWVYKDEILSLFINTKKEEELKRIVEENKKKEIELARRKKERTQFNKKNYKSSNKPESQFQTFNFILTHLGGRKLEQKAYFYAGDTNPWILDLRDGKSKFKYNITGRVGNDAMCGLTAKDNFGKSLAICITKMYGDAVEIELRYFDKILTFKGYIKR